jgi:hypothetical protein
MGRFADEIVPAFHGDLVDPRLVRHASPRQVAGGPLAENILKCQLKALDQAEYLPVVFAESQWARLQAAFPGAYATGTSPASASSRRCRHSTSPKDQAAFRYRPLRSRSGEVGTRARAPARRPRSWRPIEHYLISEKTCE